MESRTQPLVSVVMPAYNAGPYVAEAVRSVIAQTWANWELIIVDDGSTDDTRQLLAGFSDPRIRVIHQENRGCGNARNRAMDEMNGEFIAFLDADDVLPPRSIEARVEVLLADPSLSFADGAVLSVDRRLREVLRTYMPSFTGEPFDMLIRFSPRCFFGNTWMIRASAARHYRFDGSLSHAEDLMFYLTIAPGRRYGFTHEPVLLYRVTGHSTMSQLEGLERSYHALQQWMHDHPELVDRRTALMARFRVRRMMSGSYWHAGRKWSALRSWFR